MSASREFQTSVDATAHIRRSLRCELATRARLCTAPAALPMQSSTRFAVASSPAAVPIGTSLRPDFSRRHYPHRATEQVGSQSFGCRSTPTTLWL